MEIHEWVKAARKKARMTMEQLAAALEMTKGNVFHWEHGNHKPSFVQILKIKNVTGMDSLPLGVQAQPDQQHSPEAAQLAFYLDQLSPDRRAKALPPLVALIAQMMPDGLPDEETPQAAPREVRILLPQMTGGTGHAPPAPEQVPKRSATEPASKVR